MDLFNDFYGPNAGYVLELYERFLKDPESVDAATRAVFERWSPMEGARAAVAAPSTTAGVLEKAVQPDAAIKASAASSLAHAIRTYGHLAARLDPLGSPPPGDPWLDPGFYGINEDDLRLLPAEVIGGHAAGQARNALEAIHALQSIYSTSTGYEYGHVRVPEEREWLRRAAELGEFRPPKETFDPVRLLERLTQVETFEQFLHRIFPGKTRFSIEGLDMMVPMLDEMLGCAAESGVCTVLIGMAHRGRLNVLAHILGKPYAQILAEFKDPVAHSSTRAELGWTGDVKYHKGARHAIKGGEQIRLVVGMPPNPSHLEHVDPLVEGMARAAGSKVDQPGAPQFFTAAALPVLIHGDASFPGQGIVAETLNLSRLPGYWTGGSIHIISNNQLGYTTLPSAGRSTLYASDMAKGFQFPIMHVNADDPQACIEAARTAFAYREKFKKDFLIDLIGYRRYGHNEGDEPTFTQPRMYQRIQEHPPVRQLWASELVRRGQIDAQEPERMVQQRMNELQEILSNLEPTREILEPPLSPPPRGAARQAKTAVPLDLLRELNEALLQIPDGFNLHRKLERAMQRRRTVFDHPDSAAVDWATAEELAFATILTDGIPVRLTGEDTARGTFSQRHAVFHDTQTGETITPLQRIPQAKASFEVIDSPLSENAAIGFELGYNLQSPKQLVVWEAQYGDFINAAQAIIDEFLVSARAKWGLTPSLVLLLPHAYEGQGPDHSSGRMERFLQLAADTNLRLANCTTAAQYFHLLRRQSILLDADPLPLIVMTPKSLLRHPSVASAPVEFTEGSWQPVIDDRQARDRSDQIRKLVLCSGKIYVDLITSELHQDSMSTAIVRIEQLYPFPAGELRDVLEGYPGLEEVAWVQEEPANMGAWSFAKPLLEEMIQGRLPLRYFGRPPGGSPAEGSTAWHTINQKEIVKQALTRETTPVKGG